MTSFRFPAPGADKVPGGFVVSGAYGLNRRAAAAFDAAGAQAQAATDEAQTLQNDIKIAERRAGLKIRTNGVCFAVVPSNAMRARGSLAAIPFLGAGPGGSSWRLS